MSKAALARRAAVSLPTVQRLFAGREGNPRTDTLLEIASALGVEVLLSDSPRVLEKSKASEFCEAQARAKAKRLARLVQGTMALEAEAVDTTVLEEIEEQNFQALLGGPRRRLWGK
jgi:transcriptional regulator with XRE-family HTH domain